MSKHKKHIMMDLRYENIIQVLNEKFPELFEYEECREIIDMAGELSHLPYLYFPAFWQLLKMVLTGEIHNDCLRGRIFQFMEDMAKSQDADVVNLMQIEMLEPIFSLEYQLYRDAVYKYLHPESIKLHKTQEAYFIIPQADGKR